MSIRDTLPLSLLLLLICSFPTARAADADGDGVADANDVCENTMAGSIVNNEGRPLGDVDGDCDVDLADFAIMTHNFSGPHACVPETCNGIDDDCDGVIDDTFDFQHDPENCGGCGVVCDGAPNASPACWSGECDFNCDAGWSDCNFSDTDGCEFDVHAPPYCGSCEGHCYSHPHTTTSCGPAHIDFGCVYTCHPGWMDCDGYPGCEVNFAADPNNCGFCLNACDPGQACVEGQCVNP